MMLKFFFLYNYSPGMLLFGTIMSLVLIVALMVKRKETPTNFYLLGAFVSSFLSVKTVKLEDDIRSN